MSRDTLPNKIGADNRAPRLQFHGFMFSIVSVAGGGALTGSVSDLARSAGTMKSIILIVGLAVFAFGCSDPREQKPRYEQAQRLAKLLSNVNVGTSEHDLIQIVGKTNWFYDWETGLHTGGLPVGPGAWQESKVKLSPQQVLSIGWVLEEEADADYKGVIIVETNKNFRMKRVYRGYMVEKFYGTN